MMKTISFVPHGYCHALYKVFCLIATGVNPRRRDVSAALQGEDISSAMTGRCISSPLIPMNDSPIQNVTLRLKARTP